MKERSVCYLRQPANRLPRPVKEVVLLDVRDDGISLLFSFPSPNGTRYTQERFFYSWKDAKFTVFPDNLLIISGSPEETIDHVPLVITQESSSCTLVDSSEFTIAVKLSKDSTQTVQEALRRHGGKDNVDHHDSG